MLEVALVEPVQGEYPIFNFEVEDAHSYLVGEAGVWVHNMKGEASYVRFGKGPESAAELAEDAAKAEAEGFPHGVSVKKVDRVKGSDKKHRSNTTGAVDKRFKVEQTGERPRHHTVHLPKPVTEEVAKEFNDTFKPK